MGYNWRIYPLRPWFFADYPVSVEQMFNDDCEMLEEDDREKPRAQLEAELRLLKAQASGYLVVRDTPDLVRLTHETIRAHGLTVEELLDRSWLRCVLSTR